MMDRHTDDIARFIAQVWENPMPKAFNGILDHFDLCTLSWV